MICSHKKGLKYLFSKYKNDQIIILEQLGVMKFNYDISQSFV